MSNEARIRTSLQINKGNLDYRGQPTSFQADVDAASPKGPSPGAFQAATAGTDVDFSNLSNPSLCRVQNLDTTNFVEVGIWDGSTFHPLVEILPGESYVIRLSRNITTVRIKADTAAADVVVDGFEK